jgi:hypothetical protein
VGKGDGSWVGARVGLSVGPVVDGAWEGKGDDGKGEGS